jgi:hypothetical protein
MAGFELSVPDMAMRTAPPRSGDRKLVKHPHPGPPPSRGRG